MTWHSCTVGQDELGHLLAAIRQTGGTVTSCRRCSDGVGITWTTREAGSF